MFRKFFQVIVIHIQQIQPVSLARLEKLGVMPAAQLRELRQTVIRSLHLDS